MIARRASRAERVRFALVSFIALGLVVAGCGSGDDSAFAPATDALRMAVDAGDPEGAAVALTRLEDVGDAALDSGELSADEYEDFRLLLSHARDLVQALLADSPLATTTSLPDRFDEPAPDSGPEEEPHAEDDHGDDRKRKPKKGRDRDHD